MTVRLIIFDFDGVLADSGPWMESVFNDIARKFGFREVDAEGIEKLRNMGAREGMRMLGVRLWHLPKIAKHLRAINAQADIDLVPGVPQMLDRLSARGIKLAIVSSNAESNVRRVLGPLASHIGAFSCGASMFGKARKLKAVARAAGVPFDQVLCIGDETRDIEAARRVGLPCAASTWGYATEAAMQKVGPDYILKSVDDILALAAA
jgi:phosphoglycolate phosphatase